MAKELIISANVHEKKVAILEDGVVTEFYVERRDENQGVVGNLYKGRVMKVLPGMQSAFVDIGLERDAFLYVSDFTEFMEEEEEIDFRETVEEKPARPDDRTRRQEQRRPGAAAKPAPAAIREEESAEPDVRYDAATGGLTITTEITPQGGVKPVEVVAAIYDLTEDEKISISSRVRRLRLYLETPALAGTPGTTDAAAFASMQ